MLLRSHILNLDIFYNHDIVFLISNIFLLEMIFCYIWILLFSITQTFFRELDWYLYVHNYCLNYMENDDAMTWVNISTLLTLCEGNLPHKGPAIQSFDVSCVVN